MIGNVKPDIEFIERFLQIYQDDAEAKPGDIWQKIKLTDIYTEIEPGFYDTAISAEVIFNDQIKRIGYYIGNPNDLCFLDFPPNGVCDTPQQHIERFKDAIAQDQRNLVVVYEEVQKKDQTPDDDGWCWAGWGEYIGTQNPQAGSLYSEPEIERVFCFFIYEVAKAT